MPLLWTEKFKLKNESDESAIKLEATHVQEDNAYEQRKPWETRQQWILRRDFIAVNKKRLSDTNELHAMARIFVDVRIHGICYTQRIMDQLAELSRDIPSLEKFKEKKKRAELNEQLACGYSSDSPDSDFNQRISSFSYHCGYGIGHVPARGTGYAVRARGRGRH